MVLYAVSVFDSATQAFAQPFFVPRPAAAIRSFTDEVNRAPTASQANALYAHPGDYELWQLGIYDDNEGAFQNNKERLCRAIDVLDQKPLNLSHTVN